MLADKVDGAKTGAKKSFQVIDIIDSFNGILLGVPP